MFQLRRCTKGLENYCFSLAETCKMDYEMLLHTTYKRPSIRIIRCTSNKVMYSECGLVQPFLFRIQLYQARVSV